MSNTATFRKSVSGLSTVINYANNEKAWVSARRVYSATQNSTAIEYWDYAPNTLTLTVKYKNGDTYYRYEEVPMGVIFNLMTADSLGQFIAKSVKPYYSVA